MSTFALKYPANKWRKQRILEQHKQLRPHLPTTAPYASDTLAKMLARYPVLYLKPKVGGGGKGIVRVSTTYQGPAKRYLVQTAYGIRTCTNLEQLQKLISKYPLKHYIIQQGVSLIQINQRPIDFRVLMGKVEGKWTTFGIMGKVAAKGKHVTNYSRGGDAITLQDALQQALRLTPKQMQAITANMIKISNQTAATLSKRFPHLTQLGIDLAIDRTKHIYLLEANSRPNYQLFRAHDDPQLYGKIARWIQAERSRDVL